MDNSDRNYGIPYRNTEGYADPTTHDALTNVMRSQQIAFDDADARNNRLIKVIKSIIDIAGFDLVARIEVRDRKTGRIYK